jgi:hypothetical protein
MRFESSDGAEEKALYQVVRRDTFVALPGDIVEADDETGKATMKIPKAGTPNEFDFTKYELGESGMRIVRKK